MNGIIFNKHGHVAVLTMQMIGKNMADKKYHHNHVVLRMIVHNLDKMVLFILIVVVMDQLLLFTSDIPKH
jgi:hypothetical protein